MTLVRDILKGIADVRALDGHIAMASPLRDLVEHYNKIALHNDNLPKITALSTGSQLKQAITLLDPEDQVALLHKYSMATKTLDTPDEYRENPETVELRQLRLKAFKICIIMLVVITCVMVGATITIAVKSGTLPNDGVMKTIVSTAGDIIQLILSPPAK